MSLKLVWNDKETTGKAYRKYISTTDPDEDCFICPAGELLTPRKFKKKYQKASALDGTDFCLRCSVYGYQRAGGEGSGG